MFVLLLVRVLERIGSIDDMPRLWIAALSADVCIDMRISVAYGEACSSPDWDPLPRGPLQRSLATV